MSLIDIIILIVVITIVVFLTYSIFFKKGKSHCDGCSKMTEVRKNLKKIKKEINNDKI